jgi:polyisoprenoid-binding protein YceI
MLYYTDAIDYPEVVFISTQAIVVNDSVYIEGNLTFHGVTKKIKTNAFISLDRNPSINGTFYINLSDFNITRPSLMFVKIKDRMRIDYFFKNPN